MPFDAAAAVVATLHSLPAHQAVATFGALRLTSRHWRHGPSGADGSTRVSTGHIFMHVLPLRSALLAACPCSLEHCSPALPPWLPGAAVDDALRQWAAPAALLASHGGAAPAAAPDALSILLRRFRNLRALALDWFAGAAASSLSTAALQALASLCRLEALSLRGFRPSVALFRAVAALPRLRTFSFEPGGDGVVRSISSRDSSGLAGDPGASPAPLAGCAALTSLELRSLNAAVRLGGWARPALSLWMDVTAFCCASPASSLAA